MILIPDANGIRNISYSLSQYLINHFKVVTFDRCGFGNSKLIHSLPSRAANLNVFFRIKQDAYDVRSLVIKLSNNGEANVLDNSSGAIVVMEVLQNYPEVVSIMNLQLIFSFLS